MTLAVWRDDVRLADLLHQAKSIACTLKWRPRGLCRGLFPTLDELPEVPRMRKRDGRGLVPCADLRQTVAEMLSAWETCPQLAVDLQFREALLVAWRNAHDDMQVVSPLKDVLGDVVRMPGCCAQILQLWHTRRDLSPAVEVFACAQIMYRRLWLGQPAEAEKYMQRALGIFSTTDFDEFVQATFFAYFGLFRSSRQGSAEKEASWKNDAWEFLLYTSELHMQCGMVEMSLWNLMHACKFRLHMATVSPASAAVVETLLKGIGTQNIRKLPDRRLAHRMALILQARRLQGHDVALHAGQLAQAVCACPVFLQEEIVERLPLTKNLFITTEHYCQEASVNLDKHAPMGDLRPKLSILECLVQA